MDWIKAAKQEENVYTIPERWVFLHYYEALNLLFRIENALRVFVYIVLKNEFRGNWSELHVVGDDSTEGTIASIAKKRMAQSKSFGYLGHSVSCPVMHLTSGELTRIVTSDSYWKLFRSYFWGSKEVMKNKLEEIGSVRNSLAHFRPIKTDDVDVISQNSKHVLMGVEKLLSQVFEQSAVVPTNTQDTWYAELRTLGTEECSLSFHQSTDEEWIRILMDFACSIVSRRRFGPRLIHYNTLALKSSAAISEYAALRDALTYLAEYVPYARMSDDLSPILHKQLAMVFSRKILDAGHAEIKTDIEQFLVTVSSEIELIKQDNLARGKIIYLATTTANGRSAGESVAWSINQKNLATPVSDQDPPEYWGNLGFTAEEDFIAATDRYPWMPDTVSPRELTF